MRKPFLLTLAALAALTCTAGCGEEQPAADGEATALADEGSVGVLPLETFLTNISDPRGEKHARVQVKLAIVPQEAVELLQADTLMMARLHDRVLTLLTTKNYRQLNDPQGKEAFRNEIRDQRNPLLKKGQIKEVLFSDFVVE